MPEPANTDAAASYLQYRSTAGDADRYARYLHDTGGEATPAKPGQAPAGKPIAPAGTAGATLQQQPQHSMAYRTAADVTRGTTVDQPRALYYGLREMLKNVYDSYDDFGKWADEKLGVDPHSELGGGMDKLRQFMDTKGRIQPPESNTGKFLAGTYGFLGGLALTRRAMAGAGLPAELSGPADYGYSALKGFVTNLTSWDPHQTKLSNLIESVPALRNPVTQYLASKPGDTEAEGRLKNALEGTGLGLAADGLFKAIRLLRDVRGAQAAAPAAAQAAAAPEAGVGADAFRMLGDEHPQAELVSDKPFAPTTLGQELKGVRAEAVTRQLEPGEVAAAAMPEKPRVFINWARIDTPEDVQAAMQHLSDRFTGPTRVQGLEEVKLSAAQENAFNVLSARRQGEPLNGAQTTAVRELWTSAGDKMTELAQRAAQPDASPADLFAFRKMAATYAMVNEEVVGEQGIRRASARSLGAWRIPVGSNTERLQDISGRLADFGGGAENTRNMAQFVLERVSANQPYELSQFAQKGAWARTRDAAIQAFTDGLLSSPKTQAKILASNVSTMMWSIAERKLAEKLGGDVAPGEAAAMWSGWVGSFRDGMSYLGKSLKTGVTGEGVGEPHSAYPSYLSSEALNLDSKSALGQTADFISSAFAYGFGFGGRRGIAAQHDMALTMSYRAELNAQAWRQAYHEVNAGGLAREDFAGRVADLMQNTPEALRTAALDAAKTRAFLNNPKPGMIGATANWLMQGRQEIPALRLVAPFVKIPANIFQYTFERTPFAPLMAEYRANINAGGATADLARAQAAMGSMITMTAADMVLSGNLKGGGSPIRGVEQAEEREGMRRDSMKIGNRWYNINGIHPIGKLMLMAADVTENLTAGQTELHNPEDATKITVATSLAIARTLADNAYMQGFANMFAMIHDANAKQADHTTAGLVSLAQSTVPNAFRSVASATDPYEREVYSMLDAFKAALPMTREGLPLRRNLWGYPVSSGEGGPATRLLSPVSSQTEKHTAIDDELIRLNADIEMPHVQQQFGPRGNEGLVNMRNFPAEYSKLLELSGHGLKAQFGGGAPANLVDTLNDLVQGKGPLSPVYNLYKDSGKTTMIKGLIEKYQQAARDALVDPTSPHYSPALAQEAQARAAAVRSLKGLNIQ